MLVPIVPFLGALLASACGGQDSTRPPTQGSQEKLVVTQDQVESSKPFAARLETGAPGGDLSVELSPSDHPDQHLTELAWAQASRMGAASNGGAASDPAGQVELQNTQGGGGGCWNLHGDCAAQDVSCCLSSTGVFCCCNNCSCGCGPAVALPVCTACSN